MNKKLIDQSIKQSVACVEVVLFWMCTLLFFLFSLLVEIHLRQEEQHLLYMRIFLMPKMPATTYQASMCATAI